MDMRIKLENYEPTVSTTEYANEKIGMLAKHLGGDLDGVRFEVAMGKGEGHASKGEVWFCEIKIVKSEDTLFARADAESVDAAIDAACEELMSQMRKEKDERISSLKEGGAEAKEMMRQDFGDEEAIDAIGS